MDKATKALIEEAEKYCGPLDGYQKGIAYRVANGLPEPGQASTSPIQAGAISVYCAACGTNNGHTEDCRLRLINPVNHA